MEKDWVFILRSRCPRLQCELGDTVAGATRLDVMRTILLVGIDQVKVAQSANVALQPTFFCRHPECCPLGTPPGVPFFVSMARLPRIPGTTSVSVKDIHRMLDSESEITVSERKVDG